MLPATPLPLTARAFLLSLRDGEVRRLDTALLRRSTTLARPGRRLAIRRRAVADRGVRAAPRSSPLVVAGAIAHAAIATRAIPRRTPSSLRRAARRAGRGREVAREQDRIQPAAARANRGLHRRAHGRRLIEESATSESQAFRVGEHGQRRARARGARVEQHPRPNARGGPASRGDGGADARRTRRRADEALPTPRALSRHRRSRRSAAFVGVASLRAIGALVTRSGFTFRPFGVALVNRNGEPALAASRAVRAAVDVVARWWRCVVRRSSTAPTSRRRRRVADALDLALVAVFVAGAVWAILHPSRGIQDRIAGTWIVPR